MVTIFHRPILHLPCGVDPSFVVKCNPILFELQKNETGEIHPAPWYQLPYRIVFAVGTKSEVIIYDTQHASAIANISGYHLASITDLAWSPNSNTLIVSSRDAFCSIITFGQNEIGIPYVEHQDAMVE